jgi:hypothetical protein
MRINGYLSLSKNESDAMQEKQGKIELISCPGGGNICSQHLISINKSFVDSNKHQQDKNYLRAIQLLKEAFHTTEDLQQEACKRCALMFRSTITRSIEEIHTDLHKMSTGIFRNRRYKSVYIEAGNVLKELKEEILFQQTENRNFKTGVQSPI